MVPRLLTGNRSRNTTAHHANHPVDALCARCDELDEESNTENLDSLNVNADDVKHEKLPDSERPRHDKSQIERPDLGQCPQDKNYGWLAKKINPMDVKRVREHYWSCPSICWIKRCLWYPGGNSGGLHSWWWFIPSKFVKDLTPVH